MSCLHGNKKNLPDAAEEGHIIKMFPHSEVKISLGPMPRARLPNYRLFLHTDNSGIMLDSLASLLCSKLCRRNVKKPTCNY